MTVPVIDGVDRDTLEYRPVYTGNVHFRGIFEWGMFYKENELPDKEAKKRQYHSEPYPYVHFVMDKTGARDLRTDDCKINF